MPSTKSGSKIKRDFAYPTTAQINSVVEHVEKGNYLEIAAACAGIPVITCNTWVMKGKEVERKLREGSKVLKSEEVYYQFYWRVKRAEAAAESGAVGKITSSEDWRASMTYLARRYRKRWGRTLSVQITEQIDELLDQLRSGLLESEYEKVLSILAKGKSEEEIIDGPGEET